MGMWAVVYTVFPHGVATHQRGPAGPEGVGCGLTSDACGEALPVEGVEDEVDQLHADVWRRCIAWRGRETPQWTVMGIWRLRAEILAAELPSVAP